MRLHLSSIRPPQPLSSIWPPQPLCHKKKSVTGRMTDCDQSQSPSQLASVEVVPASASAPVYSEWPTSEEVPDEQLNLFPLTLVSQISVCIHLSKCQKCLTMNLLRIQVLCRNCPMLELVWRTITRSPPLNPLKRKSPLARCHVTRLH